MGDAWWHNSFSLYGSYGLQTSISSFPWFRYHHLRDFSVSSIPDVADIAKLGEWIQRRHLILDRIDFIVSLGTKSDPFERNLLTYENYSCLINGLWSLQRVCFLSMWFEHRNSYFYIQVNLETVVSISKNVLHLVSSSGWLNCTAMRHFEHLKLEISSCPNCRNRLSCGKEHVWSRTSHRYYMSMIVWDHFNQWMRFDGFQIHVIWWFRRVGECILLCCEILLEKSSHTFQISIPFFYQESGIWLLPNRNCCLIQSIRKRKLNENKSCRNVRRVR